MRKDVKFIVPGQFEMSFAPKFIIKRRIREACEQEEKGEKDFLGRVG